MQTSALPTLLHTLAERSMQVQHALERETLVHRAGELAAIAQALAGAPITLTGVTLMHTGRESAPGGRGRLSNDVLVHAKAMAVDEPDVRAALAGLRSFGSPQGSTLFEHPEARWMLSVRWMETPAVVEEIAA
jgi:hypothetical protein